MHVTYVERIELLDVVHLSKYFIIRRGLLQYLRREKPNYLRAVDDVSFRIDKGEIVGLVGESGSGKTTLARLILRLLEPTSGNIFFEGQDILSLNNSGLKEIRKKMQIVFQDPYGALNPRLTVRDALEEPLKIHGLYDPKERVDVIKKMLKSVGLNPPDVFLDKYPHELSGGQKQRVVISRALILNPSFIVMDEPVSLLDATVRTQILNLILKLKEEFNLTYLFITHDLALARYICNRILVMYRGKIVEAGEAEQLISEPLHPYTKMLIAAVPVPNPSIKISLPPKTGELTEAFTYQGCRFCSRCPEAEQRCRTEEPPLTELGDERSVACWKHI
ncbi:MAG: ABC transporter ATP-binding protein [Candidatus Bathyarchaeia archaeon]